MPCSALKLEFSFFFLDAGAVSAHSAVNWSVKIDKCDYFIQINEDNIPLLSLTGSVAGSVYSFQVYDTKYENKCMVNNSIKEKSKMELVRHSFKNSSGEVCFLDNLTLKTDSDGGVFSYYVWFSGVSFRVSCEPSASIPDKCGKSKNFAETVLLSDNAFKCDSLGGKFDGGVYPQKAPDGTDEYCVSGTCSNLCDSAWHKSVVKEIKDSVCCGRMRLEPQTGNGKCTEPKAMDSTKIGVHFPEVKLGCSVTPAGGGLNYCEVPSSSSSSSFDDAQSSSSYENAESSSSGEGEGDSEVDCFADVGMAVSNLHSKIRRCEQEGGVPDFSEYSGCVYGSCLPPSSSSSGEQSSSSGDGESGVCPVDSQFLQKDGADLYDDWVYEGETLYGYDTVLVAVNPRSGFYDILGRLVGTELADLEKRVKGFYIYKNRQPRKIFDIKPKTMPMYRKDYIDSDGDTVKFFRMENEYIFWDSTAYSNGNWKIMEKNKSKGIVNFYDSDETITTSIYDKEGKINSFVMINREGKILHSEEYVWKNRKLSEIVYNGIVMKFFYGKNSNDTIKVIPSDNNLFFFHRGYDGSAGQIPQENDDDYNSFIHSPYTFIRNNKNVEYLYPKYIGESLLILRKGGTYQIVDEFYDMPKVAYHNLSRDKVVDKDTMYRFPHDKNGNPYYGYSIAYIPNESSCKVIETEGCNKFKIEYEDSTFGESITLEQSGWIYNTISKKWEHRCWSRKEMELSYLHERIHIRNARNVFKSLHKDYISTSLFDTKEECETVKKQNIESIKEEWKRWSTKEGYHTNTKPRSPPTSPIRDGVICDE